MSTGGRAVAAGVLVSCLALAGCGGGGKSSKSSATTKPTAGAVPTSGPTTTIALPAGIQRNDQFCNLAQGLVAKLAKPPGSPAETARELQDMMAFFAQAGSSTPPQLAPDIQKLNDFYKHLVDQINTRSAGPSLPFALSELADSGARLKAYFSRICGVDGSVFSRT